MQEDSIEGRKIWKRRTCFLLPFHRLCSFSSLLIDFFRRPFTSVCSLSFYWGLILKFKQPAFLPHSSLESCIKSFWFFVWQKEKETVYIPSSDTWMFPLFFMSPPFDRGRTNQKHFRETLKKCSVHVLCRILFYPRFRCSFSLLSLVKLSRDLNFDSNAPANMRKTTCPSKRTWERLAWCP